MQAPRDRWFHDVVDSQPSTCEPERMNAEDPLFILYTSGSTGKPKGVLHTTGGYLLYAAYTHEAVFDLREDDIYCTADVGWVTGHSYIVRATGQRCDLADVRRRAELSGHLALLERDRQAQGEHFLHRPDRDPCADARRRAGEEDSRASLRLLGSVGEPINPEAWRWYYEVVGDSRARSSIPGGRPRPAAS